MSSGIQSLLKTEKEAAAIESEARKYRTTRLKAAKADAQQEIDEYKKSKEKELAAYEAENAGLIESIDKEADVAVEKELKSIRAKFDGKKATVISQLVEATISPTPEIHINAQ